MTKCKEDILGIILREPTTLMNLRYKTNCAYETVSKYVDELESVKKITHKNGKFKIFYNPKLKIEKIEFFEIMLNNSVRSVILVLLHAKNKSQTQLVEELSKSHPTISRTLKVLRDHDIVTRNFNFPVRTYSIKDKSKIISFMKDTHPRLVDKMTDNISEMFM
jgi:DNA-binding transcriptional ArsR family regulator